jgi:hypothetical protein
MPDSRLVEAAFLLDAGIEHARCWPQEVVGTLSALPRLPVVAVMGTVIDLLRDAERLLVETHPEGKWTRYQEPPRKPFLRRADGLASEASELIDAGLRFGVQSDLGPDEVHRLLKTARSRAQAARVQLRRVLATERRAAS